MKNSVRNIKIFLLTERKKGNDLLAIAIAHALPVAQKEDAISHVHYQQSLAKSTKLISAINEEFVIDVPAMEKTTAEVWFHRNRSIWCPQPKLLVLEDLDADDLLVVKNLTAEISRGFATLQG